MLLRIQRRTSSEDEMLRIATPGPVVSPSAVRSCVIHLLSVRVGLTLRFSCRIPDAFVRVVSIGRYPCVTERGRWRLLARPCTHPPKGLLIQVGGKRAPLNPRSLPSSSVDSISGPPSWFSRCLFPKIQDRYLASSQTYSTTPEMPSEGRCRCRS